jgi:hypothetical protein
MAMPKYLRDAKAGKTGGKALGRPAKYTSAEDMQRDIDKYYRDCEKRNVPYTVAGLAVALDMDRASLVNYSNKEAFFDTIKKARQKIEASAAERLEKQPNCTGIIFSLKNNFGWVDRQEIKEEHSGTVDVETYFRDDDVKQKA